MEKWSDILRRLAIEYNDPMLAEIGNDMDKEEGRRIERNQRHRSKLTRLTAENERLKEGLELEQRAAQTAVEEADSTIERFRARVAELDKWLTTYCYDDLEDVAREFRVRSEQHDEVCRQLTAANRVVEAAQNLIDHGYDNIDGWWHDLDTAITAHREGGEPEPCEHSWINDGYGSLECSKCGLDTGDERAQGTDADQQTEPEHHR